MAKEIQETKGFKDLLANKQLREKMDSHLGMSPKYRKRVMKDGKSNPT